MTKNDVLKLFNMLERLYNGHSRPRDNATLTLWATVLEPWNYEEVRDVAIKRARENRHFPDPSELATMLPPRPDPSWMKEYIRQRDRRPDLFEKTEKRAAAIRKMYHDAGLPTASEAKNMGINHAAWCEMVNKAFPDGVPDVDISEQE